jgi:hypothetical protein
VIELWRERTVGLLHYPEWFYSPKTTCWSSYYVKPLIIIRSSCSTCLWTLSPDHSPTSMLNAPHWQKISYTKEWAIIPLPSYLLGETITRHTSFLLKSFDIKVWTSVFGFDPMVQSDLYIHARPTDGNKRLWLLGFRWKHCTEDTTSKSWWESLRRSVVSRRVKGKSKAVQQG